MRPRDKTSRRHSTRANITRSCYTVSARLRLPISLRYPVSPPLATNVLSNNRTIYLNSFFPGINITLSWTEEVILLGAKTVKVNVLYKETAVWMWRCN